MKVFVVVGFVLLLLTAGCASTKAKKYTPPKYDPRTVPVNNA